MMFRSHSNTSEYFLSDYMYVQYRSELNEHQTRVRNAKG